MAIEHAHYVCLQKLRKFSGDVLGTISNFSLRGEKTFNFLNLADEFVSCESTLIFNLYPF